MLESTSDQAHTILIGIVDDRNRRVLVSLFVLFGRCRFIGGAPNTVWEYCFKNIAFHCQCRPVQELSHRWSPLRALLCKTTLIHHPLYLQTPYLVPASLSSLRPAALMQSFAHSACDATLKKQCLLQWVMHVGSSGIKYENSEISSEASIFAKYNQEALWKRSESVQQRTKLSTF